MAKHQQSDKFCSQVTENINSTKYKDYKIEDGLLYQKTRIKDHLFDALVVPGKLHHYVLQAAHENLGRMGINKTYAFLQQWHFWPGMKKTNHQSHLNMSKVCTGEFESTTLHTWFPTTGEPAHVSSIHGFNWPFPHY